MTSSPSGGKKESKSDKKPASAPNLSHSTYYINRELSWLEFNKRVLFEALDETNPLLERVKFLSIFNSNLDEFFMIRVGGLRRQLARGTVKAPPDGLSPAQQLAKIRENLLPALETAWKCWENDLQPKLFENDIEVLPYGDLTKRQRKQLRKLFEREIFPILTPLAFDPAHPFPHISNLSVNLAVILNDPGFGKRFARVKVPHLLPRLVRVPDGAESGNEAGLGLEKSDSASFVWLEQLMAANLDLLFPGVQVVAAHPFRVIRNADVEIEEDEASDLLEATKEMVGQRHFGFVIRLEIDRQMPQEFLNILINKLALAPYQIYSADGPVGLADLIELTKLDRPELKDRPFQPAVPGFLRKDQSIFSSLKGRDLLSYFPYDSFGPVIDFVRQAAQDPHVLAIKQTLYRVGPNSPIVAALKEARENGKQVSALVELKARFDEENNIEWAQALERAGVHVVYGILGLKVHAKMSLVVRKERDRLIRYVHLGTGNYNPVTARIYSDLGLFTTDPDIAADVSVLFNALTGYSREEAYKKLLVAPGGMRRGLINRINREIRCHRQDGSGHLIFKMNSIVDKACIRALYKASQAGVKVELQVRGICGIRPGIPRVSENIRVTSIVGRFLEHTRIFYFHNGGNEEILMGSADVMPRNLQGRVETLVPIEDERIKKAVREDILALHLRDNVKCWVMDSNGQYKRVKRQADQPLVNSQEKRLAELGSWHLEE